jgi:hypothetical protein
VPITWNDEYDAWLLASAGTSSGRELADAFTAMFGVPASKDAINNRLRHLRLTREAPEEQSPLERFEKAVDTERRKAEDRAVAREMALAVKSRARWDEFLDIVRDGLVRSELPPLEALVVPQGDGTAETMVVLVGDVHIGKYVDPAVVGQGFGYSIPIFEQRFSRLQDRVLRLFALHSQTAPITTIRVYFLGDGVDGVDMRRGHPHRVDVPAATRQMLALATAFEGWVRRLAAGLPTVKLEIVWEFGNHGRVGEFGVNLPVDNWDFVAGQVLAVAIRDLLESGQVQLIANEQKYSITNLGPYRVYSSHGDGVKGGDGFAGLPINGLARALAKDTGLHLQLFDLYLTAHFHTPQDITTQAGRIVMNGAWDGGDDYSINQLKAASEPIQWAFGIHPVKGMTWQQRIWLAPYRRLPTPVEEL